eukprot:1177227-Prorocentrum_minimum.AAC.3
MRALDTPARSPSAHLAGGLEILVGVVDAALAGAAVRALERRRARQLVVVRLWRCPVASPQR